MDRFSPILPQSGFPRKNQPIPNRENVYTCISINKEMKIEGGSRERGHLEFFLWRDCRYCFCATLRSGLKERIEKPFLSSLPLFLSFLLSHLVRSDFRLLSRVRYFFRTDRLVTVTSERPQKFPRNQLNSHRIARVFHFPRVSKEEKNFPSTFPLNFLLGDFVLCHFVIEIFSYTFFFPVVIFSPFQKGDGWRRGR